MVMRDLRQFVLPPNLVNSIPLAGDEMSWYYSGAILYLMEILAVSSVASTLV